MFIKGHMIVSYYPERSLGSVEAKSPSNSPMNGLSHMNASKYWSEGCPNGILSIDSI